MTFLTSLTLNTIFLLLAAHLIPGFVVSSLLPAVLAALVLGLINTIIRPIFVVLTFPLTLLTFGLFIFVVNALMIKLAAAFVPGFQVFGLWPAVLGAVLLSILNWLIAGKVKASAMA